jgi:hypothetical protein
MPARAIFQEPKPTEPVAIPSSLPEFSQSHVRYPADFNQQCSREKSSKIRCLMNQTLGMC